MLDLHSFFGSHTVPVCSGLSICTKCVDKLKNLYIGNIKKELIFLIIYSEEKTRNEMVIVVVV